MGKIAMSVEFANQFYYLHTANFSMFHNSVVTSIKKIFFFL